jgi:hypothetical protein
LTLAQFDRHAVFGHGFARTTEPVLAHADVEVGASLMTARPVQRASIFKDRQFVLPAMEIPVASLYCIVAVVYLGFDTDGGCRQGQEE